MFYFLCVFCWVCVWCHIMSVLTVQLLAVQMFYDFYSMLNLLANLNDDIFCGFFSATCVLRRSARWTIIILARLRVWLATQKGKKASPELNEVICCYANYVLACVMLWMLLLLLFFMWLLVDCSLCFMLYLLPVTEWETFNLFSDLWCNSTTNIAIQSTFK